MQWATTASKKEIETSVNKHGVPLEKEFPFISVTLVAHLVIVLATRLVLAVQQPLQSLYRYAALQQPSKKPLPGHRGHQDELASSRYRKLQVNTVVFTRRVT